MSTVTCVGMTTTIGRTERLWRSAPRLAAVGRAEHTTVGGRHRRARAVDGKNRGEIDCLGKFNALPRSPVLRQQDDAATPHEPADNRRRRGASRQTSRRAGRLRLPCHSAVGRTFDDGTSHNAPPDILIRRLNRRSNRRPCGLPVNDRHLRQDHHVLRRGPIGHRTKGRLHRRRSGGRWGRRRGERRRGWLLTRSGRRRTCDDRVRFGGSRGAL